MIYPGFSLIVIAWAVELAHLSTINFWSIYFLFVRTGCKLSCINRCKVVKIAFIETGIMSSVWKPWWWISLLKRHMESSQQFFNFIWGSGIYPCSAATMSCINRCKVVKIAFIETGITFSMWKPLWWISLLKRHLEDVTQTFQLSSSDDNHAHPLQAPVGLARISILCSLCYSGYWPIQLRHSAAYSG